MGVEDFEYQEEIWDHDDFWIDQREADDYRHEDGEFSDDSWEAEHDWERDDG